MTDWTTAAITRDLVDHLWADRWLAVSEVQVGDGWNGQRADVLAMRRKFNGAPMVIFEIKTSRADLLSDLRREKWRGYLKAGAVAFAFPQSLADLDEIPTEAGVYLRGPTKWRWARPVRLASAPRPSDRLHRRLSMTLADQIPGRQIRKALAWDNDNEAAVNLAA